MPTDQATPARRAHLVEPHRAPSLALFLPLYADQSSHSFPSLLLDAANATHEPDIL